MTEIMQANWIITSNSERVIEKLNALNGLQAYEISTWVDMAEEPARLQQALILSDFPSLEQRDEQAASFSATLRDYVHNGGGLTVLGESAAVLASAFPELVTGIHKVETGQTVFSITDPALAHLAGEKIAVDLTTPLVIPQVEGENLQVFVQLAGLEPLPVVFAFTHGGGYVFCQPFPLGILEKEDTLVLFLAATTQTQPFRKGMLEKVKKERASVAAEYPFLLSGMNPSISIDFSPLQGKNAFVLLYWQGNARIHLYIEDELGRLALNHTRESPPFAWYAPMPGGKWRCRADLVESQDAVLPMLLACCNIDSPARRKFPQGNPAGPARVRRCPKCKMPLSPDLKFCPACGRKVDLPAPS